MNKEVVKTESMKLNGFKSAMVLFATAIFILVMTQMVYLSMLGTKGSDLTSIVNEKKEILSEMRSVEDEISEMKSLIRLHKMAYDDLGLVKVSEVRLLKRDNLAISDIKNN
jgi:hypothetical protein